MCTYICIICARRLEALAHCVRVCVCARVCESSCPSALKYVCRPRVCIRRRSRARLRFNDPRNTQRRARTGPLSLFPDVEPAARRTTDYIIHIIILYYTRASTHTHRNTHLHAHTHTHTHTPRALTKDLRAADSSPKKTGPPPPTRFIGGSRNSESAHVYTL